MNMLVALMAVLSLIPQPSKVVERPGRTAETNVVFAADATVPAGGYRLATQAEGVRIASSDAAGRYYALQTLRQIEADAEGRLPIVEIEDAPAYRWRGFLIDDCRHFMGKETLKKTIDLMSRYKFNVLHWHLTEDQGWRIDVPGFPELVKYGAVRPSSPKHETWNEPDGMRYGPFYYTESDVREIVAYARERQVTIVPEIELPGHFMAALAAYPRFACRPENFTARSPRTEWGIAEDVMCVGNDEAVRFLEHVLDYVCRLFPGEYVHIGGDECPVKRWKDCPKCKARMKAEGLGDERELQPWLTRRIVRFLADRGKRAVGWDEYIADGIPTNAVAMFWRATSEDGGDLQAMHTRASLAKKGYDIVSCPSVQTYLCYSQELADDPFEYFPGCRIPLANVYAFDPAEGVGPEDRTKVLGGQCCAWSERIWNQFDLEWKMWPRALAMSEALWCGSAKPGFADFARRAAEHRIRLLRGHVNCAPLGALR